MNPVSFTNSFDACVGHASYSGNVAYFVDFRTKDGAQREIKGVLQLNRKMSENELRQEIEKIVDGEKKSLATRSAGKIKESEIDSHIKQIKQL